MNTRRGLVRAAIVAGLATVLVGGGAIVLGARDSNPTQPLEAAGPVAAPVAGVANQSGVTAVISALQTRLKRLPKDWQSLAALGSAYVEQARLTGNPAFYPKAQLAFEQSLTLESKNNYHALGGLSALAAARHEFTKALEWADKGLAVNASNAGLYGVKTDALVELGRYDEADVALQKMADLRPDLSLFVRASYLRELRGDVPGALRFMQDAEQNAVSAAETSFTIYHQGTLKEDSGRIDEAEADYKRAQQVDPASQPAREGMARIAAARGQTAAAITAFEALVNERPLPSYSAALTELYITAGQPKDADRARELLTVQRKLLEANGVNADLELALYSADSGVDIPQAVAAGRAEWAKRKSIHVADALAWSLYADGKFPEAKTYADQALRIGTRSAPFYFHRGMINAALGDAAGAKADLQMALAINPRFSLRRAAQARTTLARLAP